MPLLCKFSSLVGQTDRIISRLDIPTVATYLNFYCIKTAIAQKLPEKIQLTLTYTNYHDELT